jgi:hypothetical protein
LRDQSDLKLIDLSHRIEVQAKGESDECAIYREEW